MPGVSVLEIGAAKVVGVLYAFWAWMLCLAPRRAAYSMPVIREMVFASSSTARLFYWPVVLSFLSCIGLVVVGAVVGTLALLILQFGNVDIPGLLRKIEYWPW